MALPVVTMPKETQNAIKLFMELQTMRSIFDPGDLPAGIDFLLNQLIHETDHVINIRKELNL